MTPNPNTPSGWAPAIRSTLLWVLPVAAIGLALQYGGVEVADDEILLELDFPRVVELASVPAEETVVQASVRLRNNLDTPFDMEMPSPCHVFRWNVFTPEGQFIQSTQTDLPECRGTQRESLAPGEEIEAAVTFPLDTRRYQPGAEYVLRYRYWGVEGERTFRAD